MGAAGIGSSSAKRELACHCGRILSYGSGVQGCRAWGALEASVVLCGGIWGKECVGEVEGQTQLHITSQPSALDSLFKVGGAASYSDAGCMPFCTRAPAKELARKRPMSTPGWVGGRKILGSRALFSSMPLRQTAASSKRLCFRHVPPPCPIRSFVLACAHSVRFRQTQLHITSQPSALDALFKVGGAASYSDAGRMPFCTRAPAKELARKRPMSTSLTPSRLLLLRMHFLHFFLVRLRV